jgi:predicted dienelactone hydrolase
MEAPRDENRIPVILAALNTDGVTPNLVYADNVLHALMVSNGTTGFDFGIVNASRDENRRTVAMAISSVDGTTPVELYSDSLYRLLIQST